MEKKVSFLPSRLSFFLSAARTEVYEERDFRRRQREEKKFYVKEGEQEKRKKEEKVESSEEGQSRETEKKDC